MYIYDENKNEWIPLRTTAQYKQKKKFVRDAWIVIGILMCGLPASIVMVLALLTTFLSFMLLDESIYTRSYHQ
ncbi:hypothetical protein [Kaarinaea lacus]